MINENDIKKLIEEYKKMIDFFDTRAPNIVEYINSDLTVVSKDIKLILPLAELR